MVEYNHGIIFYFSEKADIVPGYDFLVNSVWPEIVRGLEEKLPSLFNPGNPDVFHEVINFGTYFFICYFCDTRKN